MGPFEKVVEAQAPARPLQEDSAVKLTFTFDSLSNRGDMSPEDAVDNAMRDFVSRIVDKVAVRPGLAYWLYSQPGYRVGSVKVESQKDATKVGQSIREDEDPCVDAKNLIRYSVPATERFHKLSMALAGAFSDANKELDGLKRLGSENIEAPTMLTKHIRPAIEEIQVFAARCLKQLDAIVARAK